MTLSIIIHGKTVWVVTRMAINKDIRSELCDEAVVFNNPSFDNAIIGTTIDSQAVYDYDKMVQELMNDENISEQEAIDWIEYNTIRALPYASEMRPIIMFTFKEGFYA